MVSAKRGDYCFLAGIPNSCCKLARTFGTEYQKAIILVRVERRSIELGDRNITYSVYREVYGAWCTKVGGWGNERGREVVAMCPHFLRHYYPKLAVHPINDANTTNGFPQRPPDHTIPVVFIFWYLSRQYGTVCL